MVSVSWLQCSGHAHIQRSGRESSMNRTELEAVRSGNTCNAAVITTKKPVHPGFCRVKQLDCNGHRFIWCGGGKGYNCKLNSGILGEGRSITLEVEERRLPGFLTVFFFYTFVCVCARAHVCLYVLVYVCHEVSEEGRRQLTGVSLLPLAHTCAFIGGSLFLVKVASIVAFLVSCSKRINKQKQTRMEVRN